MLLLSALLLSAVSARAEYQNLRPDLLDSCSVPALYAQGLRLARAKMTQPWVQRVHFSNSNGTGAVAFAFQQPDGSKTYFVRLKCSATVEYEFTAGPNTKRLSIVRDLSGATVSAQDAFAAAYRLLPGAVWNNASIVVRRDGRLEYMFWSSWNWKNQPTVRVDAATGAGQICAVAADGSETCR